MFAYNPPSDLLAGRTILVTGAGDGIGRAAAESFAAHGASVILCGRTQEKLEQVYDGIESRYPGLAMLHPLDLASATENDFLALTEAVAEHYPALDGLLHNAAQLGPHMPIAHYPYQDWQELVQVNVNAAFLLTKALLPALGLADDARLLFTASSVGRKGRAYWGAYSVTKFAVEGLMQVLAEELEKTSRIRVNSLNPGGTRTAMRKAAYPAEDPAGLPTPESLMSVYLYLMGPDSRNIHGQALNVRDFDPADYQAGSDS